MSIFQESKESQRTSIPPGRPDMTAKDESGLASSRTGRRGKWPQLPRLGLWLSIQYVPKAEEP